MGKLYLASQEFGGHGKLLKEWLPKNPRTAVILNAVDQQVDQDRSVVRGEIFNLLSNFGLKDLTEIDLRTHKDEIELNNILKDYDLIWVRGGNAFYLRWLMRESTFDKVIVKLLNETNLIYAGSSAGSCVMSESLKGIEFADDKKEAEEVIYEGLGYVKPVIVPHWLNPEYADGIQAVVDYLESNKLDHIKLEDEDVIVVEEDRKWRKL